MKKNILFIAVDDLRPELFCFGKNDMHTPNIDRLAEGSVVFKNAYCQVPLCMPSRASLLGGVRPKQDYAFRVADALTDGEPTLPGYFKNHGYDTISIGKIYHFNNEDESSWTRKYRDTFYENIYVCDGYCSGYQLDENLKKMPDFRNNMNNKMTVNNPSITECADAPEENYPDAKIAGHAVDELYAMKDTEQPFFLAVGFYRPHLPWAVPKKYWDLYDRDEIELADNPFFPKDGIGRSDMSDFMHYGDVVIHETYSDLGRYGDDDFPVLDKDKQKECIHGYKASVSFMDAQLGKVLDALYESGKYDDTIIIMWGDNGWHLGEHKLWSKVTAFEEATHIPLIISAPGMAMGSVSEALTELVDIYPTLCDLTGLELPSHIEGTSMVPLLHNPDREWKKAVFSRIEDAHTVRSKHFRLTHYRKPSPEGDYFHIPNEGEYELFDLDIDPRENVNEAKNAEYSDALNMMKDMLSAGWQGAVPE